MTKRVKIFQGQYSDKSSKKAFSSIQDLIDKELSARRCDNLSTKVLITIRNIVTVRERTVCKLFLKIKKNYYLALISNMALNSRTHLVFYLNIFIVKNK